MGFEEAFLPAQQRTTEKSINQSSLYTGLQHRVHKVVDIIIVIIIIIAIVIIKVT